MANTFNKLIGMVSTYHKVETFLRKELSINLYYTDTEENVENRISAQLKKAFGKENVDNQHYVGCKYLLNCDKYCCNCCCVCCR